VRRFRCRSPALANSTSPRRAHKASLPDGLVSRAPFNFNFNAPFAHLCVSAPRATRLLRAEPHRASQLLTSRHAPSLALDFALCAHSNTYEAFCLLAD
jgi:hypothetical protein